MADHSNPPFRPAVLTAALLLAFAAPGALAADAEPEKTLAPVKVTDKAEKESAGYQGGATRVGKVTQLPKDVPQALTIVSEALIEDKNADTLKEALRNVAGLSFNAGEGGRIGDNMTLRGFSSFGDLYLDGIRDVAQYNRETFNIEQVEVLRGSAAMLFGRGQAGGVINQASKEPGLMNKGSVTTTLGSYDYKRVTADVNQVVGENAALRVTAMKTDAGSSRDRVETERDGFAPTLRWGIGTADEFSLGHYYLKTHNTLDYGVPFFHNKPLDVPASRFYGTTSDYEDNTTNITTGTYKHRFSNDTELRTVLRYADYTRDLWGVAPRLPGGTTTITDSTVINRGRQARGGHEQTWTSQTDFTTKFATGAVKHEVLAGLELLQERAGRWSYNNASIAANPSTTVGNPDNTPVLPQGYGSRYRSGINTYEGVTVGTYAQDAIEFLPGWKVLLGARHDKMDAEYSNGATVDFGEWSYRTGLSWQPDDYQHYYLAFSDSFNPTADLYQFTTTTTPAPPERSKTLELGSKWELFEGDLSLRTSLYRAEKEWERNTDVESASNPPTLANPYPNLLTRKRHTNGFELEAAGRITNRWEVFFGWALLDAKIDEAKPGGSKAVEGMRPRNTPHFTYSLWSTYRLDGGWRVGGGVEGKGERLAYGIPNGTAVPSPNVAPGYRRWDAMVSYEQAKYVVKLNILNLFDKRYYESVYENGGHVVPGTQRAAQMSVEYKF